MKKRKLPARKNRRKPGSVLRLPDLEHAKSAVLNSLTSVEAQRGYSHAIDEFVDWYTQTDNEELLAAQNLMLDAIFKTEPRAVQ